jgi:hypothetical protein
MLTLFAAAGALRFKITSFEKRYALGLFACLKPKVPKERSSRPNGPLLKSPTQAETILDALSHQFLELIKQIACIVRTWRCFRMVLHGKYRVFAVPKALQGIVI